MTIHTLLVVLLVFAIIAVISVLTMVCLAHKKIWEAIRDAWIVLIIFLALRPVRKPRNKNEHPLI
ncbi:MAG: hypothetical protein WCW31_05920 [Patescibacteria group bacterium]|jgi:hypothetical protein